MTHQEQFDLLYVFMLQTSDFPVLDPGWTAQEEMSLLEAVMDCGFGNWWVVPLTLLPKYRHCIGIHKYRHFQQRILHLFEKILKILKYYYHMPCRQ